MCNEEMNFTEECVCIISMMAVCVCVALAPELAGY